MPSWITGNRDRKMILSCSNTTFKYHPLDIGRPSVFIYDRNDPSGASIRGLFFIYHFESRLPLDTGIPHYGYIKIGESIQPRSSWYPHLFQYEGADVAVNHTRLEELRIAERMQVFNGKEGEDYHLEVSSPKKSCVS